MENTSKIEQFVQKVIENTTIKEIIWEAIDQKINLVNLSQEGVRVYKANIGGKYFRIFKAIEEFYNDHGEGPYKKNTIVFQLIDNNNNLIRDIKIGKSGNDLMEVVTKMDATLDDFLSEYLK